MPAPADTRALAEGARLNTDNNLRVELGAAAGSVLRHWVKPEIDAWSSGLRGLPRTGPRLVWSEANVRAYADGLRAVGRDPTRYLSATGQSVGG